MKEVEEGKDRKKMTKGKISVGIRANASYIRLLIRPSRKHEGV